ncbi:MAG: sn-glycerol-3-phosphate ABC transporter ATP-binding protein UgpC [Candidatus Omnitrophica bacterium]|nr:sn-glycerol-3-phosphate ABC transporter ATP-binding protein UgpC [Candidatus Omnitrophota bacterium]
MAQVSIRNLSKIYANKVSAVDNVNLGIERSEFVVLVGPSGCGKSTTLRMVAGLEEMTAGEIWIGDRLVNGVPAKDRNIAMVFQNYALYPHMNAYDNMAFALKLRKHTKSEIETRVKEAAEILGVTHLLTRKPRQLSGGERQRIALGRAIVRHPLVFLFDEPLSNLDAKMRVQMRTEIDKLHLKIKTTMIYVTHDQTEAMALGDRIAVMRHGKVQQFDEPLKVYDHPANKFVAGFIGSPPMNFMDGKLYKQNGALYFDAEDFKVKIPQSKYDKLVSYAGKKIFFGIRPECIFDRLFATNATEANTIPAVCDVLETMGANNFVYLVSGKHKFIAVFDASNKPAPGSNLDVVLDMEKGRFFDADTEETIT